MSADPQRVVVAAARNNAEWCDLVCRSHGLPTRWSAVCWSSPQRTPPLYPDAVTLVPATTGADLHERIDGAPCARPTSSRSGSTPGTR